MELSCAHCLNRARWVLTRERLQREEEPLYSNNGYQFKSICELLNATPKETNEFLQGKLNSQRKSEFIQKLRDISIVI